MRKIVMISALMIWGFHLSAQNTYIQILREVEKNNTTLKALRKEADAQKIEHRIGLTPPNPEIEFNYLWGNPAVLGNRTDFSVRQSLDFPTAYKFRTQLSDMKSKQAELEFSKQRNELLFQTHLLCVKLTYHNALHVELAKRHANAVQIAQAFKAKYDVGEVNVLDFNKAQLNLLKASNNLDINEIERSKLHSELLQLNGGLPLQFSDSTFSMPVVSAEFDQWLTLAEANNPLLQWLRQEIAIAQKEVQLNAAMNLPKLNGGFMSEKVAGQQFQGVTVGITIPLWENRNKIRHAKARSLAVQSLESDTKWQFYNQLQTTHTKVVSLQNHVADFRSKLTLFNHRELLEKALVKGEISLTNYLYELSLLYESRDQLLEIEMNFHLALANLSRFQL